MSRAFMAAALLLAAATGSPEALNGLHVNTNRKPRKRPTGYRHAGNVSCPRCGASPGEPCSRRTLGRHPYHMARAEAASVPTEGDE